MKNYKEKYYDFAISDFDGTIYNSNGEITKETVSAVNAFINRGGTFCICTGRMTASIRLLLNKFSLNRGYVISYNGAEITNIETGEKLYKNHIDTENAVKILEYAEKMNFQVLVYPNDVITTAKLTPQVEEYFQLNGIPGQIINGKVSEYIKNNQLTTGKALFLTGGDSNVTQRILKDLPLILGSEFNITNSNKFHVDIMRKDVSKGETIKIFAKTISKSLDKLICFGDEMNDASMMKVANLAAVMQNGSELLKKEADIIIDSCDNDGVRKAIEKYCI